MGTWDTGPFDNDSAADFAADIQACSGPDARHDLLLATLRAGTSHLSSVRLTDGYAWGYEVEHAVAAAAFVVDEYTGMKQFTNCSYARGVDDNMELNPYVEFHLTPELLDAARKFTDATLTRMRCDCIDEEWAAPVRDIRTAFDSKE